MLNFVDFQKRSQEGPLMTSGEFDRLISKTGRSIIKKYNLRELDKNTIIADDETADKVFQAAVDFLSEVGVYNTDTQRVIQWSKEEVLEIAKDYKTDPKIFNIGFDEDEIEIRPRNSKDITPPILLPAGGPIFDQQSFIPCIMAYAKEECVKGLSKAGNMALVNGIPATKGMPGEIYCSIWEADQQGEALKRAGRPGMFRGNVPTATSLGAILAAVGPGRFEKNNFMVGIHINPEQKLDWDRLNTAFTCEALDFIPWSSAMSLIGGLCGGSGGAAMGVVANLLAELSYGHGPWCSISLTDITGSSKSRDVLKSYSLAHRAVERNIGISAGTPCVDSTQVTCYEEAIIAGVAIAITTTASGATIDWFAGSSPLTARIQAEVNKNIAGLPADKINVMINNILKKIDEIVVEKGEALLPFTKQTFPAIYNNETLKPNQDYLEAVVRAVDMLKDCRVPITDALVLD